MSAYFFSMVLSDTDDCWREAYYKYVPDIIKRYRGEIIASSMSPVVVEGNMKAPLSSSILRFPSLQDGQNFLNSEEYRPFKESRMKTGHTEILALDFDDLHAQKT